MPTMWLLNTSTLRLQSFPGESKKPKYAILSHRWGSDEATFQDVNNGNHLRMRGWGKIASACGVAREQGHKYLWADTCCINKVPPNNKEQNDAINSMYEWYGASVVCYAYLEDVVDVNDEYELKQSQWFQRGWTLQEMLAPEELIFFSQDWRISVDRFSIPGIMDTVAGVVGGAASFWFLGEQTYTIDDVMSWASRRNTTVPEDAAYSLIGLFKLERPLRISYGEGGGKAFVRLQEQLMKQESYSSDMTIFNWTSDVDESVPRRSMFATSPQAFEKHNRSILIRSDITGEDEDSGEIDEAGETSLLVAEDGLHMSVPLLELQVRCVQVGNASYELRLGSAIITGDDDVSRTVRDAKIFVSEKNGSYYEAFNVIPSFRSPGRLRFYLALMSEVLEEDRYEDDHGGILLVSRENELEKHRVIMNRRIGISGESSNGEFSDPPHRQIIIA